MYVRGAEKCCVLTRELWRHECSSVKRQVMWHQVSEKPWSLHKLSNNFYTQALAHTCIKEGEGQPPGGMMGGKEDAAKGPRDPWLTAFNTLCGWLDTVTDYFHISHRELIKGKVWHFTFILLDCGDLGKAINSMFVLLCLLNMSYLNILI